MAEQQIIIARRAKIKGILYVFFIAIVILILRLFYLQIEKARTFAFLGEKNFIKIEVIPPLRGDVYDSQKVLLAANRPVFDLYWHGGGKFGLDDDDMQTLSVIQAILNKEHFVCDYKQAVEHAEKRSRRVLLAEDVSFEQLCQLSEQCAAARCLVIANRFKRVYPHQTLASHVLGYLNRGENVGKSGVEYHFDAMLQGREGRLLHVINSTGKSLTKQMHTMPQAGNDVILTIDYAHQRLAEKVFEPDQSGALIVMDPSDGAIKALVSYPRFDPNIFMSPLSESDWSNLMENNPLLNRATSALYPPASLFKLVTFAAGLEEGVIDQSTEIQCNGYVTFGGRKYYCMRHVGHGKLTPRQALAMSCNIPCYNIARKLKIDCLASYAQRFGLGRKTNFILPEKEGLVPTTTWKQAVKSERWWKGETLSACIGQGYYLATPLQLVRMVGAISSGSLVKPRLIVDEPVEREPLDISTETLHFLRSAMRDAVSDGTVQRLRYISGFEIFGKTGTAQTCSLSKEKLSREHFEHAWVAGYFSYKNQPPLAIMVLVEHAGSSVVAVRAAEKFLRGYKMLHEQHESGKSE